MFWDYKISTHKRFEFQLEKIKNLNWFIFKLLLTEKRDHAGFVFELSVLKLFFLHIQIYDIRHWNGLENRWHDRYQDCYELNQGCSTRLVHNYNIESAEKILETLNNIQMKLAECAQTRELTYVNNSKSDTYHELVHGSITEYQNWLKFILYDERK